MSDRVLVFGGAGFIGSHLVARHRADGDEVHIAVRRRGSATSATVLDSPNVHEVDLAKTESIEDCFAAARPTLVYHLATRTPHNWTEASNRSDGDWFGDVENLIRLIAVAKQFQPAIRAFLRAGSIAEYGDGPAPFLEEQREQPLYPYALMQVIGTHYTRMAQPLLPFPAFTARLALTYGAGQRGDFLVPSLIRCCLERAPFRIDNPKSVRDLVHVDDVVDGLVTLARSGHAGCEVVNICSGTALTNREVAATILDVTGAPDTLLSYGCGGNGPGAHVVAASGHLAKSLLGWSAKIGFAEGVRRTVEAQMGRSYA